MKFQFRFLNMFILSLCSLHMAQAVKSHGPVSAESDVQELVEITGALEKRDPHIFDFDLRASAFETNIISYVCYSGTLSLEVKLPLRDTKNFRMDGTPQSSPSTTYHQFPIAPSETQGSLEECRRIVELLDELKKSNDKQKVRFSVVGGQITKAAIIDQ